MILPSAEVAEADTPPRPLAIARRQRSERQRPAENLTVLRAPIEAQVVHQVDGRLRLRIPALRRDDFLANRVVAALTAQPGVLEARANVAAASVVVSFDPLQTTAQAILGWFSSGIPMGPVPPGLPGRPDRRPVVLGTAAFVLSLLGAPALLTSALLAASSLPILVRAGRALVNERKLSADALDSTAIAVLLVRGDVAAASLSASLIAGGELIRELTARRSRGALSDLLGATLRSAWVLRGTSKEQVPVGALAPGDTVIVYTGGLVPVDGVVLRGRALVDQKVLTGESVPVLRRAGTAVYASTVVTEGKLYIRAERVGRTTRANRIVQLLGAAPHHDTRLANHARRIADRLVLPTLALAGGVYFLTHDVARAASVIIFDFATGIRVSAPTTVLASMTAGVHRGLLIKGGRALEQLASVDTLVFDKTGTLTHGTPHVTVVHSLDPTVSRDDVLTLAAALEQRLTHPAAEAIVRAAEARHFLLPDRGDSRYLVGLGVLADVQGQPAMVGSAQLLARQNVALPPEAVRLVSEAGNRGVSTVYVARAGRAIGMICYADMVRSEARPVLERLRARGIREFVMVTGDNLGVAKVVARELGIDRVAAEVFPEQKAAIVQELQRQGRVVAVVGDGINDSPALAFADISISLKAGSDVAQETADIVLHGDLHGLPDAVDLAREAMTLIRQNVGLVVVPNAVGMLGASLGLVGPLAATAVNNGSSVVAALNGLRPLLPAQPVNPGRNPL